MPWEASSTGSSFLWLTLVWAKLSLPAHSLHLCPTPSPSIVHSVADGGLSPWDCQTWSWGRRRWGARCEDGEKGGRGTGKEGDGTEEVDGIGGEAEEVLLALLLLFVRIFGEFVAAWVDNIQKMRSSAHWHFE